MHARTAVRHYLGIIVVHNTAQNSCNNLPSNRGDSRSRNQILFYRKLALMHVTTIVRFDWSTEFDSFR